MAELQGDLEAAIDRFSAVAFRQKAERDRLKAINADLVAALEDIASRAVRIREDKAVVGIEAHFIERVAREAIARARGEP